MKDRSVLAVDGQPPYKIVLDLRTPLESFFFTAALYSSIILLGSYHAWVKEGMTTVTKLMLPVGVICTAVFVILYNCTDNYYVLDIDEKCLFYHFEFLGYETERAMLTFSQIDALTVTGMQQVIARKLVWTYQTVLADSSGRVTVLSDMKADAFEESKALAKKIAGITGATYVEAPAEMIAEPVRGLNIRFFFEFRECNIMDRFWDAFLGYLQAFAFFWLRHASGLVCISVCFQVTGGADQTLSCRLPAGAGGPFFGCVVDKVDSGVFNVGVCAGISEIGCQAHFQFTVRFCVFGMCAQKIAEQQRIALIGSPGNADMRICCPLPWWSFEEPLLPFKRVRAHAGRHVVTGGNFGA